MFSLSPTLCTIRYDWKIEKALAIYRSGDRRGITILPLIFLTSVPSKIVEHINCSHITAHPNLIDFFQHEHGFRKKLYCDRQLAQFTQELHETIKLKFRTDPSLRDFFLLSFQRCPSYTLALSHRLRHQTFSHQGNTAQGLTTSTHHKQI